SRRSAGGRGGATCRCATTSPPPRSSISTGRPPLDRLRRRSTPWRCTWPTGRCRTSVRPRPEAPRTEGVVVSGHTHRARRRRRHLVHQGRAGRRVRGDPAQRRPGARGAAPGSRHVEMDAETWWDEFVGIATELLAPGDVEVAAAGVSGMGPCVLLADEVGTPLHPAILYGVDTRAGEQIDRITDELGEDAILERCGSVLTSQAAGPKIAWLREHHPDAYRRARMLLVPASSLAHRLTGAYVLDHHSASQCTPLYDSGLLAWHQPWADHIAPGLPLPPLAWPGDPAGTVTAAAAEQVPGLAVGTPVITGTIDAWSEAISVDAQNVGDLMLMYGTTMLLVATTDTRTRSRTLWGTVGAYEGTYNLAGGMATSGAITAWLRKLTGDADYATLSAEADAAGVGAHGLL